MWQQRNQSKTRGLSSQKCFPIHKCWWVFRVHGGYSIRQVGTNVGKVLTESVSEDHGICDCFAIRFRTEMDRSYICLNSRPEQKLSNSPYHQTNHSQYFWRSGPIYLRKDESDVLKFSGCPFFPVLQDELGRNVTALEGIGSNIKVARFKYFFVNSLD